MGKDRAKERSVLPMVSATSPSNNLSINELLEKLRSGSPRQKKSLIKLFEERSGEIAALGSEVFTDFDPQGDNWGPGWILQVLRRHEPEALERLSLGNTSGWYKAPSSVGIDYWPLQKELLNENFEAADHFTSAVLRKLAGTAAENRGYVYFSEVESMPGIDLVSLDRLWIAYSQGRFGFSVQARILKALNGRYDMLWPRIGWKREGVWTRYPSAFTWRIDAEEGHMPLVNQLRGVRLMDAILNHPFLVNRT